LVAVKVRCLDVAPGVYPVKGFEGIDIQPRKGVRHVGDVRRLPFPRNTFKVVYASHIIEHLPWYETEEILKEWARVLVKGGILEVWTVDAYKVARCLVELEEQGVNPYGKDGWKRFNPKGDGYLWCNGKLFAPSKEMRHKKCGDPCWHRSLHTPQSLCKNFQRVGLAEIRLMEREECRGYWHGWCNLGVRGVKPC
jgi:SAM-dependent methyltransferase